MPLFFKKNYFNYYKMTWIIHTRHFIIIKMGRAGLELGLGSSRTSINLDLSIYKENSGRKLVHCIISNCRARLHDPLVRNPYKSDPNRALVHAFSFACITHLLQFFYLIFLLGLLRLSFLFWKICFMFTGPLKTREKNGSSLKKTIVF
jgi:hypothetical protein